MVLGTAAGSQGWQAWWSVGADAVSRQIVWGIRLPRSLGAWLGGLVITLGYGYAATGYVGAALSFIGLLVFGASVALERRSTRALCQA